MGLSAAQGMHMLSGAIAKATKLGADLASKAKESGAAAKVTQVITDAVLNSGGGCASGNSEKSSFIPGGRAAAAHLRSLLPPLRNNTRLTEFARGLADSTRKALSTALHPQMEGLSAHTKEIIVNRVIPALEALEARLAEQESAEASNDAHVSSHEPRSSEQAQQATGADQENAETSSDGHVSSSASLHDALKALSNALKSGFSEDATEGEKSLFTALKSALGEFIQSKPAKSFIEGFKDGFTQHMDRHAKAGAAPSAGFPMTNMASDATGGATTGGSAVNKAATHTGQSDVAREMARLANALTDVTKKKPTGSVT